MVIAEVAAAYEIARWSGMTSPGSTTALDLYAGGRAWWQRGDVQVIASGTLNIFDLTFSRVGVLSAEKSVSWVDPLVGHASSPVRARQEFCRQRRCRRVRCRQQIFVAGLAALDYEICRSRTVTWSAMLGYRALSVDYSQGSGLTLYEFDMTMHGPIFGVTARF